MSGKWKEGLKRFWPPGKEQLLILVLLGLLLAVVAIPVEEKRPGKKAAVQEEAAQAAESAGYEGQMEGKLEELLSQVSGVGRVRVMLVFEGTGEKKVEKDENLSQDASQEETVYEEQGSSGRTPYVRAQSNPKVEGVLVIAEGGGSSRVKQEILEAAQALFGIDAHKIKIMKMEEGTK